MKVKRWNLKTLRWRCWCRPTARIEIFPAAADVGTATYPVKQLIIMNTDQSLWNEGGYEGIPGLEVHHVTKEAFDHGGTRRQGMRYVRADVCICMTQDAVPADEYLVERLVEALSVKREDPVAVAYARQLPDKDCRVIERYTRSFNYPDKSFIKTEADLPRLGIKTYFCSNVWRRLPYGYLQPYGRVCAKDDLQ